MDDWLVESSVIQSTTCTVGTTQKRGPSNRRGRKQNAIHEDKDDDCNDKSFVWWQGGKLSKLIFQRAILACSLVKKAARQGNFASLPAELAGFPPLLSLNCRLFDFQCFNTQILWKGKGCVLMAFFVAH